MSAVCHPVSGILLWQLFHCCCSVAKLCPILCDPKDCSMPGSSVLYHLWEFAQIHVHWLGDAVWPSHPLPPRPLLPSKNQESEEASEPGQEMAFLLECFLLFLPKLYFSLSSPASLDNQIHHLQANSLPPGLVLGLADEEFDSAECVRPGRKLNILFFFFLTKMTRKRCWKLYCTHLGAFNPRGRHLLLFSSCRILLFVTPWTAAHQASLSFTISQRLLRFMSIESVMPSNHLFLCHCLLLLPSVFPNIRVFFNELTLCIR